MAEMVDANYDVTFSNKHGKAHCTAGSVISFVRTGMVFEIACELAGATEPCPLPDAARDGFMGGNEIDGETGGASSSGSCPRSELLDRTSTAAPAALPVEARDDEGERVNGPRR